MKVNDYIKLEEYLVKSLGGEDQLNRAYHSIKATLDESKVTFMPETMADFFDYVRLRIAVERI